MQNDLADITLVVDRSGSMEACRSDAEGGINQFIKDQAAAPGRAMVTLVQFDTEYEVVHAGIPAGAVPRYSLVPCGSTALLDAVGKAINVTGARLEKMSEADRPAAVIFVITTDGLDNASKEFTRPMVRSMIERQRSQYNWQFTFLGANIDAFGEGAKMGVKPGTVAAFTPATAGAAHSSASHATRRVREARSKGDMACGLDYSDAERRAMRG